MKNKTTMEFLASKEISVLEHPPYSPNDFFLFPKIKGIFKEGILMTLMTSRII
jgi:hypothetical protein